MGEWSCPHCTLRNSRDSPLCLACGSESPVVGVPKRSSLLPKLITKPISNLSNAVVDIFSVAPSRDGQKGRLTSPPRPPPPNKALYQAHSRSPFPGPMPPPRPPPPVITLDATPPRLGSFNGPEGIPSSSSSPSLDYSVNWVCNRCFRVNELPTTQCSNSKCKAKRVKGSKRDARRHQVPKSPSVQSLPSSRGGASTGLHSSSSQVREMDTSLCSEITTDVEKHDRQMASVTYQSILTFCREHNAPFIDDSFPHSAKSIGDLNGNELTAVVGDVPREFIWLRPTQIFTKDGRSQPWTVFGDVRPSDIEQGALGDCWFLSALALIAERPDLLEHIILTKEYNASGVYQVRLCIDGKWQVILVDDFFPCRPHSRSLAFAVGRKNQLWVPLIEKALAKQMGSYSKLAGGRTIEGLAILTGAPCEELSLEEPWSDGQTDILWAQLLSAREAGYIMGCSCGSGKRDVDSSVFKAKGLLTKHAYSVLDVRQEGPHRLVRLRNPWGSFVWRGAWSDGWSGWDPALKARLFASGSETGSFWMGFDDFLAHFDSVDVAKVRVYAGWAELRVPLTMGGVFREADRAVRILIEKPTEVCFTLFQSGARAIVDRVDLMICVHRVSLDGQVGEIVCRSPRKIEASVTTGDSFLSPGEYVIVSHSMTTIGSRKVTGSLAIHSSCPIFGDTIACSGDMYTDSLIQMVLRHGKTHKSLEGVIPRYVSDGFSGLLLMVDNVLEDLWVHVKTECGESTNVISSRGALNVSDVVPPLSRQIIIVLTQFEPSQSYMVQHKLLVRLSRSNTLGNLAIEPIHSTGRHSPFTDEKVHHTKTLFT